MRIQPFVLLSVLATGCKWTDFDDLQDQAWVRSTKKQNVGATDYGLAVLGVSTGPTGGALAVLSNDSPDFSTLDYSAKGDPKLGANDIKLGTYQIAVLTDPPVWATDGAGKVALAERSRAGGNIAVVYGAAGSPAGQQIAATNPAPDAVAFAGNDLLIAAGNTIYTIQNAPMPVVCTGIDNVPAPLAVAAMAVQNNLVWVWTKSGALITYPSPLAPCAGGMLPAPTTVLASTGVNPGPGARIHFLGTLAVLAAKSDTGGKVVVVDTVGHVQAGTVAVDGLASSALAVLGGMNYIAVGTPARKVDGVAAGAVELYAIDGTTGAIDPTPALELHDAQPESSQKFGRSVTTMTFNNQQILVVAANNEVFAYYKTALYDASP